MENERQLWDDANPYYVNYREIKPEGYCEAPLYTSVNQIRKAKRRNERVQQGLTADPSYQKDSKKDPGIGYI